MTREGNEDKERSYVSRAVEPTTGNRFFLELPYLNAEMC
jgi:hypothetical protein